MIGLANSNDFVRKYTSFSGCDMVASITLPQNVCSYPIVIGNLQTVSYSIHREVSPVRKLGSINPIGWTKGTRTIGGSLIFTMFDKNLVYQLQEEILNRMHYIITSGGKLNIELLQKNQFANYIIENLKQQKICMDMMPPFDITVTMKNEYGTKSSQEIISGVVIADEGQVASIEDIITENTMSFMASDIQPLMVTG